MLAIPPQDYQGLFESTPHNICPKKQLNDLKRIMRWEREYTHLMGKAREARDFRAFSSTSSAKPRQYLSRASQYRFEIGVY
jgi:hypothetical protein